MPTYDSTLYGVATSKKCCRWAFPLFIYAPKRGVNVCPCLPGWVAETRDERGQTNRSSHSRWTSTAQPALRARSGAGSPCRRPTSTSPTSG